jgi:hypothetical protein
MIAGREFAEWRIQSCESEIRDQVVRFRKGLISKESFDQDVARLIDQMRASRIVVAVEKGEPIA